jgi:hypothetical protein
MLKVNQVKINSPMECEKFHSISIEKRRTSVEGEVFLFFHRVGIEKLENRESI